MSSRAEARGRGPVRAHARARSAADVAGIEELAPLDLRATYYDTPDLRLARNGVTLRHRTGEGERPALDAEAARSAPAIADGRDELDFDGPGATVPDGARAIW